MFCLILNIYFQGFHVYKHEIMKNLKILDGISTKPPLASPKIIMIFLIGDCLTYNGAKIQL